MASAKYKLNYQTVLIYCTQLEVAPDRIYIIVYMLQLLRTRTEHGNRWQARAGRMENGLTSYIYMRETGDNVLPCIAEIFSSLILIGFETDARDMHILNIKK